MGMLYNTNWLVRDFEFKKGVRLVGSMISRGGDLKTTRLVVVFLVVADVFFSGFFQI